MKGISHWWKGILAREAFDGLTVSTEINMCNPKTYLIDFRSLHAGSDPFEGDENTYIKFEGETGVFSLLIPDCTVQVFVSKKMFFNTIKIPESWIHMCYLDLPNKDSARASINLKLKSHIYNAFRVFEDPDYAYYLYYQTSDIVVLVENNGIGERINELYREHNDKRAGFHERLPHAQIYVTPCKR